MIEAIITVVVEKGTDLDNKNEPTHTLVRRLEFDSMVDFQAWYRTGLNRVLTDEKLVAVEEGT